MATVQQETSSTNWAAAIEGCLLVGLGAMLLRKWSEGQLALYIHPRYTWLVMLTAGVVIVLGVVRLLHIGSTPEPWRSRIGIYGLLIAPVLLGAIIPAKPAGSALVDPQTLRSNRQGYRTNRLVEDDSTRWTLYDWMFARFTLEPEQARGRGVDVIGFVYHIPGTPADEFTVVRNVIACCVADRSGANLTVKWPDAATLSNDQWVHVRGITDIRPSPEGPPELIVLNAQIDRIAQPDEPYLYP